LKSVCTYSSAVSPERLNIPMRTFRIRIKSILFILLLVPAAAFAGGDEIVWRPVTPEEIAMKTPKVDADADAEAIFWEVKLDDKKLGKLSYYHYVRVKIFTERGREKFSKFDIPFAKGVKIEDVAARVIKPDGTIVNLAPSDIFEREIVKKNKVKVMAKSFAVPGIEAGVIVEYQYSQSIKNDSVAGERLIFQRDIPMQRVSYYVRPYQGMTPGYNYYNMPDTRFREDPSQKGFQVATMTNVPAYKDEPYMPPDDEVRRWVYVSYQTFTSLLAFNNLSLGFSELLKARVTKPSKLVRQKSAELVAGATTDEEKLRRLYDFVQKKIKNSAFDSTLTDEQREKLKIEDVDDVLKKGMGSSMWIEMLFGALASAAGFEVNIVLAGDRSENFFTREKYPFVAFIHPACISVKVGEKWQFFNPSAPFVPYGRLLWYEEGVNAMMVGDTGSLWAKTPLADQTQTLSKRSGKLKLLEDGTLEGLVKLEYSGQSAILRRRDDFDSSPTKREETIKDQIKANVSTAEITNISIENFDDNAKPLTYTFNIRVPNYAQKTGKRLILQPGFFEYGSNPVFTSATRTYNIYFPYPWSEQDDIELSLPAGFTLDNADSPPEVYDAQKIGLVKVSMSIDQASNVLMYHRRFYFGANGNIIFPVAAYSAIKDLFDAFHKADTHIVTLKQK